MQVNAVLKARHPRTYRPPVDCSRSSKPGKKRGPKPDPKSKRAKLERLRKKLVKRKLPAAWCRWLYGRRGIESILDQLQYLRNQQTDLGRQIEGILNRKGGELHGSHSFGVDVDPVRAGGDDARVEGVHWNLTSDEEEVFYD